MSSRRPRQILPAAPKASSSEPARSDQGSAAKGKGKTVKRISTACEACKRRKSRCSGPPAPCTICSIQKTECIIDESLDQRRKASTRFERLLTALIQSITFSDPEQLQELVHGMRSSVAPAEVVVILKRNIKLLSDQNALLPVDASELQSIFMANEVFSPEAESGHGADSSEPSSVADLSRPASSAAPSSSGIAPFVSSSSSIRPKPDFSEQFRIYQRWVSLFGSEIDVAGETRLERQPDPQFGPKAYERGLWRMSTEPESAETGSAASLPQESDRMPKGRPDWHGSLQLREVEDENEVRQDLVLSELEGERLSEKANNISAQGFSESEQWVQTVRAIPELIPSGEAFELEMSYHLAFARHPIYTVQPVTLYENSSLSCAITSYRDAAQGILAQGTPPITVLGYDGIDVELLFRVRGVEDGYTVCDWAAELWRTFSEWDIFVRLACCLSFTYIMRWLLVPTARRYADIPDILKPLPSQRIKAHHVVIDFLPIPALREALIHKLRDFMTALPAAHVSVNWTGTMEEAIETDAELGCLRLTEAFEKHVTKLENWSIGESILVNFPELIGRVRIDRGR